MEIKYFGINDFTIMPAPAGTCPECATTHEAGQPHNLRHLHYQYTFYKKHGCWPTWADAMAHCAPDVKQKWKEALKEHGIEIK